MIEMQNDTSPLPNNAEKEQKVPPRSHWIYWIRVGFFFAIGVAGLAIAADISLKVLSTVVSIVTPFATALILALLLDPLIDKMQVRGIPRTAAVALVFVIFIGAVVAVAAMAVPALVAEASTLATNVPAYISNNSAAVNHFLLLHKKMGPFKMPKDLNVLTIQATNQISGLIQRSAGGLAAALLVSISTIFDLVVSLIVGFYLLVDIDRIRARFFFLAPKKYRKKLAEVGRDIGQVFSDYLRGLLVVCAMYGVMTTVALYGLAFVPKFGHREIAQYALLIGFSAGVLYAVPYLGAFTIALVTFMVSVAAGGFGFGVAAVVVTLIINQTFDNIIAPRVIGGGVGLNPVLAIFSLTLGGALFGLWGLLLSVPVAASLQVILFRLVPRLTEPTPASFLEEQGVPPRKGRSSKIMVSEDEKKQNEREDEAATVQGT
jgi:predicted PurR-regulated permease PerM